MMGILGLQHWLQSRRGRHAMWYDAREKQGGRTHNPFHTADNQKGSAR